MLIQFFQNTGLLTFEGDMFPSLTTAIIIFIFLKNTAIFSRENIFQIVESSRSSLVSLNPWEWMGLDISPSH